MHTFFCVIIFEFLNIVIDNKVCDNRPFFMVKGHILAVSTNHIFAVVPG